MARLESEVASELPNIGCDFTDGQLKALARFFLTGEIIVDGFSGQEAEVNHYPAFKSDDLQLIVLMSERIVAVTEVIRRKGVFGRGGSTSSVEAHLYWSDVEKVNYEGATWYGGNKLKLRIIIQGHGRTGSISPFFDQETTDKKRLAEFLERLQTRLAALKKQQAVGPGSALINELEGLAALREKHLISEDELKLFKSKLLQWLA